MLPYPTNHNELPRRSYFARVSIWLVLALIVWLVLLGAPGPAMLYRAFPDRLMSGEWAVVNRLAYVSLLSTIVFGAVLGWSRRWGEMVIAALLGTGVLAMWYADLMFANPQPDGVDDIAAGAGLAIYGPPAFLAILVVLSIGFMLGRTFRVITDRRMPAP
jgi:hypothetical protein